MHAVYHFTFTSSLLLLTIMLLRAVFRKHISMRLQYALWLLAAAKLLVFPVPWLESSLSLQKLADTWAVQSGDTPSYGKQRGDALPLEGQRNDASSPEAPSNDTPSLKGQSSDAPSLKGQSSDAPSYQKQNEDVLSHKAQSNNPPSHEKQGIQSQQARMGDTADAKPDGNGKESGTGTKTGTSAKTVGARRFFLLGAGAGSVLMLLYFGTGNILFVRYLRRKRTLFTECNSPLPVYLVEGLPSPCLCGKAIYMAPDAASENRRLLHVLAHEYCHYRQGDLIWSMLRCLCVAIYWWNPLVWLAAYLSKQDCELACDEAALGFLGEEERLSYGRTLVSLIPVRMSPKDYFSIATTMTGGRNMKQRIQRIANHKKAALSVSILSAFLAILCFISVSTTAPKAGQANPAKAAGNQDNATENAKNAAENQVPIVDGQKNTIESQDNATENQEHTAGSQKNTDKSQNDAASNQDSQKPVTSLDEAIGLAVISYFKDTCAGCGECMAQGHIMLDDVKKPDGRVTVYALTMYGAYEFNSGYFIKCTGTGVIPAVIDFSYDRRRGYVLEDFKVPMDGARNLASKHELFPEHLWEACISYSEETIAELKKQEERCARRYLKQIGRKAPVGSYSDADHPLLSDAGVSVEVSNSLYEIKKINKYPDYIGDCERMEDGVRYVYETSLDSAKEEIVYTKSVYDTGRVVEVVRLDMHTGEEI